MKCCLCQNTITSSEPVILFVGKAGDEKKICSICEKQYKIMMESEKPSEVEDAINYLHDFSSSVNDDEIVSFLEDMAKANSTFMLDSEKESGTKEHKKLFKLSLKTKRIILFCVSTLVFVVLLMCGFYYFVYDPDEVTIGGVRYSTDLIELNLSRQNLTDSDIRPLRFMRNLEVLNLSGNQISNVRALRGLNSLRVLDLSNDFDLSIGRYFNRNSINGLEHLARLSNLQSLDLRFLHIEDYSVLGEFENLKALYFGGLTRTAEEFNHAGDLINLEKLVVAWLPSNFSFTAFHNLQNLKELDITCWEPISLTGIEVFANLERLTLEVRYDSEMFDNLALLGSLTNLQHLEIIGSRNHISDIDLSFLTELSNLRSLAIRWVRINDTSAISTLSGLDELRIIRSNISDISFVSNMSNLRRLSLGGNKIEDISPISNLVNLEFLDLRWNQITDIAPLGNLTNLQELDIFGNSVEGFSVLDNLEHLTEISK